MFSSLLFLASSVAECTTGPPPITTPQICYGIYNYYSEPRSEESGCFVRLLSGNKSVCTGDCKIILERVIEQCPGFGFDISFDYVCSGVSNTGSFPTAGSTHSTSNSATGTVNGGGLTPSAANKGSTVTGDDNDASGDGSGERFSNGAATSAVGYTLMSAIMSAAVLAVTPY